MKPTEFTISDLERLTGLNRRTIHFYSQERLIPAPEGQGGGARYGEESCLRLLLIKEMQKSHLKLSGIREALDSMTLEEMRELAKKVQGSVEPNWDVQSLENWIQGSVEACEAWQSGVAHDAVEPKRKDAGIDFSFLSVGQGKGAKHRQVGGENYLGALRRSPARETSWRRYVIADGVELQVRADVAAKFEAAIKNCLEQLREKLLKGGR